MIHGWVSPTEARVLLPANVCADGDALTSLSLFGGVGPNLAPGTAGLTLEPPAVRATGAAIDRLAEVKVLDVGAGMAGLSAGGGASIPTYTGATARCRSFAERNWGLGSLSASHVDAPLQAEVDLSVQDSPALSAFVVPEPRHTGVLALLLVTSYERPVEVVSLELGDATADAVLAAAGWMEHWEAWEDEALTWREAGRSTSPVFSSAPTTGSRDEEAPPSGDRTSLSPTDPAPPLTWRPMDDLALRLEPFYAAVIVLGEWTFGAQTTASAKGLFAQAWRGLRRLASHQPEVVLTFPVLTYRTGGRQVTVGMQEPLYADLR